MSPLPQTTSPAQAFAVPDCHRPQSWDCGNLGSEALSISIPNQPPGTAELPATSCPHCPLYCFISTRVIIALRQNPLGPGGGPSFPGSRGDALNSPQGQHWGCLRPVLRFQSNRGLLPRRTGTMEWVTVGGQGRRCRKSPAWVLAWGQCLPRSGGFRPSCPCVRKDPSTPSSPGWPSSQEDAKCRFNAHLHAQLLPALSRFPLSASLFLRGEAAVQEAGCRSR